MTIDFETAEEDAMTDRHPDDDDFSDAVKALDRLHRLDRIGVDDPPPEVRMQVCRDRGHHLYAASDSIGSFAKNMQGDYVRKVPCTSCRVAVRVEEWHLEVDGQGNIVVASLLRSYPGNIL